MLSRTRQPLGELPQSEASPAPPPAPPASAPRFGSQPKLLQRTPASALASSSVLSPPEVAALAAEEWEVRRRRGRVARSCRSFASTRRAALTPRARDPQPLGDEGDAAMDDADGGGGGPWRGRGVWWAAAPAAPSPPSRPPAPFAGAPPASAPPRALGPAWAAPAAAAAAAAGAGDDDGPSSSVSPPLAPRKSAAPFPSRVQGGSASASRCRERLACAASNGAGGFGWQPLGHGPSAHANVSGRGAASPALAPPQAHYYPQYRRGGGAGGVASVGAGRGGAGWGAAGGGHGDPHATPAHGAAAAGWRPAPGRPAGGLFGREARPAGAAAGCTRKRLDDALDGARPPGGGGDEASSSPAAAAAAAAAALAAAGGGREAAKRARCDAQDLFAALRL